MTNTLQYKIIFSKRRTVSLQITHQGELVVKAPLRYPESRIEELVSGKQAWIEKHLVKFKGIPKKQFAEGELFLYMGKEYPLELAEGYRSRIVLDGNFKLSKLKAHKAKSLFEDFYKQQAKQILLERAKLYAQEMGVSFKKLNITSAGTRWGSCSSSGSVNFSWKLIMAPLEIIDYVVVHELAHITYKNHSQKFWDLVRVFYPEFRMARDWLKKHGQTLAI